MLHPPLFAGDDLRNTQIALCVNNMFRYLSIWKWCHSTSYEQCVQVSLQSANLEILVCFTYELSTLALQLIVRFGSGVAIQYELGVLVPL